MVNIRTLELDGILEIIPIQHKDERGFFSEVYSQDTLATAGINFKFVQDNHSFSIDAGVLRGLHFQTPPFAQDKLVRVSQGKIFDVAVDVRKGSPNFGRWIGIEISAENWKQILVPKGFAHGFLTLEPNTEVIYKVTAPFSSFNDRSIRFDDPEIGINWPIIKDNLVISKKDRTAPFLNDVETGFIF